MHLTKLRWTPPHANHLTCSVMNASIGSAGSRSGFKTLQSCLLPRGERYGLTKQAEETLLKANCNQSMLQKHHGACMAKLSKKTAQYIVTSLNLQLAHTAIPG
jgi:hypothetical protein